MRRAAVSSHTGSRRLSPSPRPCSAAQLLLDKGANPVALDAADTTPLDKAHHNEPKGTPPPCHQRSPPAATAQPLCQATACTGLIRGPRVAGISSRGYLPCPLRHISAGGAAERCGTLRRAVAGAVYNLLAAAADKASKLRTGTVLEETSAAIAAAESLAKEGAEAAAAPEPAAAEAAA